MGKIVTEDLVRRRLILMAHKMRHLKFARGQSVLRQLLRDAFFKALFEQVTHIADEPVSLFES
jgi:hypothetical protein